MQTATGFACTAAEIHPVLGMLDDDPEREREFVPPPEQWIATFPPHVLARPTAVVLYYDLTLPQCRLCAAHVRVGVERCRWCGLTFDWTDYHAQVQELLGTIRKHAQALLRPELPLTADETYERVEYAASVAKEVSGYWLDDADVERLESDLCAWVRSQNE